MGNAWENEREVCTPRPFQAAWSLAWREILRFFRQRNRVVGAIAQPVVFWLLFGLGMESSFRLGGAEGGPSFREYFFPGTLMLMVLFTAIFATISIIEDRTEGFLQAVLVAPIPPWSMVAGKVLGASLIALAQGLLFLLLAFTLPVQAGPLSLVALVVLLFVSAVALTSLGFTFAWRMSSTQGFHAIMNLVLMPLWLLSGAFFPLPAAGTGEWSQAALRGVMLANPVTYLVAGVRQYLRMGAEAPSLPSLQACWLGAILFAVLAFAAALAVASRRSPGGL